jgi:voltage-gated potassium channel
MDPHDRYAYAAERAPDCAPGVDPRDIGPEAPPPSPAWRQRLYAVIYGNETPLGKAFDVALIVSILVSVVVVMLESVASVRATFGAELRLIEWVFTGLFTVEYVLRLICIRHPKLYARSFFGVVDLLAILPTYLSLVYAGAQFLLVIRLLRILRIFRVLKLARYIEEASTLSAALAASKRKIVVFVFAVITLVTILGSLMYIVEGGENGFDNIPLSVYWAMVTMATVGYGDIVPLTVLGKFVAFVIILLGFGIIAVPTGIVTGELIVQARQNQASDRTLPHACFRHPDLRHEPDANYCRVCGEPLLDSGLLEPGSPSPPAPPPADA